MAADRIIPADAIVQAIAFTSDGASLAGGCADGKVRVWQVASGTVQRTLALDPGDRGAAMPPHTDILAAIGKEGELKTWNLQTGKVGVRLPGSTPRAGALTISPDRRFLVSSNRAPGNSSDDIVHIWETDARERVQVIAHQLDVELWPERLQPRLVDRDPHGEVVALQRIEHDADVHQLAAIDARDHAHHRVVKRGALGHGPPPRQGGAAPRRAP